MDHYKPIPTIVAASPFKVQGDCKSLYDAMKGFGTDEEIIATILTKRSNSQRQEIRKLYQREFEKDLLDDLKGELGGKFQEIIIALMTPPIQYLCEHLYNAMNCFGTNERTLVEILCTKTNEEIIEISKTYEEIYNRPLAEQMCSETSGQFRRLLTLIVTGVRDAVGSIDPVKAKEQAEALYAAGEGKLGTDEEVFNRILAHASFAQLRLIFEEYKNISGMTLEQAIKHEMDGTLHDAMMAIIECVQSPPAFFANCLHKAIEGAGTDETTLIRILVSRSEIDLGNIKDEFERIYNRTLRSAIESEVSGDCKMTLLAILGEA